MKMKNLRHKLDEAEGKIESILRDISESIPDESDMYWDSVSEFLANDEMVVELWSKGEEAGVMIYNGEIGDETHQWFSLEDLVLNPRFVWEDKPKAYRHFSKIMRELADKLDKVADNIE